MVACLSQPSTWDGVCTQEMRAKIVLYTVPMQPVTAKRSWVRKSESEPAFEISVEGRSWILDIPIILTHYKRTEARNPACSDLNKNMNNGQALWVWW